MSEQTEAYFNRLAASGYQPLLHRVTGTLRFDIDQDDGSRQMWYVKIEHGNLDIRHDTAASQSGTAGTAGDVDCVLMGYEDEFERILTGQDSFAAAFVRGAITVRGDHTLAQNLRRFSPPALAVPEEQVPVPGRRGGRGTGGSRKTREPGAKKKREASVPVNA